MQRSTAMHARFSGENNKQHEDATDRDIYFVDGVADDKHHDSQGHLDHVVDHQVNEKYTEDLCRRSGGWEQKQTGCEKKFEVRGEVTYGHNNSKTECSTWCFLKV